jgi:hypothetical protein
VENVEQTIISQYANSPTIVELIRSMNDCIDPRADLDAFYNLVWNVDTAEGFGLDFWGRVVDVPRLLRIPANDKTLGFTTASVPADWAPFNQGVWHTGASASQAYLLPDDLYRVLILTKALANIVAVTAPSLNRLLRNLFPGRGKCYVLDNGNMSMSFFFEFSLTPAEYAILTLSGVLPHPAGVMYNVIVAPPDLFGFSEAGIDSQPFDQGTFYVPAGTVI